MKQKITGITLCTPDYKDMAMEAVRRWRLYTGLPVKMIVKKNNGFHWKLRLDEIHNGPCVFFDADWWLLRDWKPDFAGSQWIAVHDPMVWSPQGFPGSDSDRFKLDKTHYFNSGFFQCDLSLKNHRAVFQHARKTWAENKKSKLTMVHDWTDQFHLNYALQKLNIPLAFLGFAYNYFHYAVTEGAYPMTPRCVMGLHGAGIQREHKLSKMRMQAAFLSDDIKPMLPESILFDHARHFETR